jgi:hypothetical protein
MLEGGGGLGRTALSRELRLCVEKFRRRLEQDAINAEDFADDTNHRHHKRD